MPKLESGEATTLRLRTLGAAGLYAGATSELVLGPGKPLALLIYLALAPGRRASREFLAELLWADLEPERARNTLRQTLFHLRKLLGDNALPGADELFLALAIETDRDCFLAAVERGEPDVAVQGYTGAFLPDFGIPGGAAFEHWADLERDRLRSVFMRSGELVVRRLLNESRIRDAQRVARRIRDEAPDQEAAWRLLLESIIAGRDFVAAAVEAEAIEKLSAAEGVTLEPATRVLIARARQVSPDSGETSDARTIVAELIGREREFSAIIAAWESARSGRARHLHLVAPAGLGKTRLLRDVVGRLRAGGACVIESRGAPGDREIPYSFAADIALALATTRGAAGIAPASAATLIGLNPAVSSHLSGAGEGALGEDALRRRTHALIDLLHAIADEQPVVLVIDDLHWIDESSYRVLEGLFARLADAHVLCLTAGRPERRMSSESVTVLPLPALAPAQVSSLISALGSVPDGPTWARGFAIGMHGATNGSPLLILETLRLALDGGVLQLDAAGWTCLDETRLESLLVATEAVRHRVRSLPPLQQWVLALLATIGTPLESEALAVAADCSPAALTESLIILERLGFVSRTHAGWIPAHDEIGDATRAALDDAEQRRAEHRVGALLVATAAEQPQRLLRGIRHLVAARDDGVARHFAHYVQLVRRRHDRRSVAQLAGEALGESADAARIRGLVAAIPVAWRLGLWSRSRQAGAAALAAGLAAGIGMAATASSGRAAMEQRLVYTDSAHASEELIVDPARFDGGTAPLTLVRSATGFAAAARAYPEQAPSVSPDGRSVAWTEDSGDSTTLDIWLRTPAGTRRLTTQARDDKVNAWLPDGSALVGMTNRWTPRDSGNYDIAVFDTATGAARQLTSGRDHDGAPVLSPDGTRILFIRQSLDQPVRACVMPFDGADPPDCRLVGGRPVARVIGWSSLTDVLLVTDSASQRPLVRYDWTRDRLTELYGSWLTKAELSPDRRWVVAASRTAGVHGFRDWIIPVDRPNDARPVSRPNTAGSAIRWWEGRRDHTLLIDRVEFTDTTHTFQLGITTRLAIRALNSDGAEIPLHGPVRWSSSDTLVATVDARGDVRPRAGGAVTISASLSGWRATSRTMQVRGASATTVLDEGWDDHWSRRWILFGDPRPMRAIGPQSIRGLWSHGDGTFPSFALYRSGFSARNGLGVEVRISTPITRDDWQRLRTAFVPGVDTVALQRGDQKKAPLSARDMAGGCGVGYPIAMGEYGRQRIGVEGGGTGTVELGRMAKKMESGAWWTLRLQLLPDGRCGVAIDGVVVWLSAESVSLDGTFWLRLGDESLGSTLLHGPLQVWTGVKTDIDWFRALR